jgi:hypothetical protein
MSDTKHWEKSSRHKLWQDRDADAIIAEAAEDVKHTLIVRWLPPDPNDRSNYIEPEPD